LRWAPNIDALMMSYERTGIVPPALASRPTITPDVSYLLECFALLSRHRQSNGFATNPIPLADIVAVSGPLGFRSSSDFLFFAEIMGDMDREFLSYDQEQQKLKAATKKRR
jgi:hypothetical protein